MFKYLLMIVVGVLGLLINGCKKEYEVTYPKRLDVDRVLLCNGLYTIVSEDADSKKVTTKVIGSNAEVFADVPKNKRMWATAEKTRKNPRSKWVVKYVLHVRSVNDVAPNVEEWILWKNSSLQKQTEK